MTRISILAAALLATASAASFAGELYTPQQYDDSTASHLTRAQVHQDVLRAQAAGELAHNDPDLPKPVNAPFGKTRAQAKAEVLAARANGQLAHTDADVPSVATSSVLSRQQVRAEAVAANRQPRRAPGMNTIDY